MPESSTPIFPARVIDVIDQFKVVINRGAADVRKGQRFLIYAVGKELFDPETKESLGRLELVRGTGAVTHVQEKLATITSDRRTAPRRKVVKPMEPYYMIRGRGEETTEEPGTALPFDDAENGDYAKPV